MRFYFCPYQGRYFNYVYRNLFLWNTDISCVIGRCFVETVNEFA